MSGLLEYYNVIKWLHVVSSVVLIGTGFGTAFYMWSANHFGSVESKAFVARFVVKADWFFTTPAVFIQPATGMAMIHLTGIPYTSAWLLLSLLLYVLIGALWLPVVWLQLKLRNMAQHALDTNTPLDPRYKRIAFWWEALGYPAFAGALLVFYLMIDKPTKIAFWFF